MIDLEFMKSVFESSLDINSSELTLNSEFEEVPRLGLTRTH